MQITATLSTFSRIRPERLTKVECLLDVAMAAKKQGQHNRAISRIQQSGVLAIKLIGNVETT